MIHLGHSGIKNKPFVVLEHAYILLSNGDNMCIPKGYYTDLASVPWIFRFFLNHVSQSEAFVVHDYLYNYRSYKLSPRARRVFPVSRIFADKEMHWQMIEGGSKFWRADLYYIAVRLFGWMSYGKI